MSNGLFQHLPGSHEMGGADALPNEPWLLPISDRIDAKDDEAETLLRSVQLSARPFRIAANALCAVLALLLTAQVATGWMGSGAAPGAGRIADATPPTISAERASLAVHQ